MSVPYRMIDIKTSDKAFKSLIVKYFDDFKKFMKSPNLQCPPIKLVDKFDDKTCAQVKNGILEVSKIYFIVLRQGAVPVLYHEFIHIYDENIIALRNRTEEFGLIAYTEFHATIIQMMIATGYISYYKEKKISIVNKIIDMRDNCSIFEYFEKLNNIKKELCVDIGDIKTSFNKIYKQMLYYIGKMYFAQKYIIEDTSSLLSLDSFISIFGDEVVVLKELLFTHESSNDTLCQLAKIQDCIIQKFDEKYNTPTQ